MRKFFTALIATAALVIVIAPHPTHAANLPKIVPDCDQTQYLVQEKLQTQGPPQLLTISPDDYGVDKAYKPSEWDLVQYKTSASCTLNDLLQVFVNLFSWGLYVVSVLALFFFFLGGGVMLLSGGSAERVKTGKTILLNTIIGLVIALGSWVIVNLVTVALLPNDSTHVKNGIAYLTDNQPWFKVNVSSGYQDCSDPPEYPCKAGAGAGTVRAVQQLLNNELCVTSGKLDIDGSFGPQTLAAWHLWQSANGVTQTDILSGQDQLTKPCIDLTNALP